MKVTVPLEPEVAVATSAPPAEYRPNWAPARGAPESSVFISSIVPTGLPEPPSVKSTILSTMTVSEIVTSVPVLSSL